MRRLNTAAVLLAASFAFGVCATSALAAPNFEAKASAKQPETEFKHPPPKEKETLVQEFKFGPIVYLLGHEEEEWHTVVKCEVAKPSGTAPTSPTTKLAVKVNLKKCTDAIGGKKQAVRVLNKKESLGSPEFEYEADGGFNIAETIEFDVPAIKCKLTVEPEDYPPVQHVEGGETAYKAASYDDEVLAVTKPYFEEFPSHTRDRIKLSTDLVVHPEEPKEPEEKASEIGKIGMFYEVEPYPEENHHERVEGECGKIPPADRSGENGFYKGSMVIELPHGNLQWNEEG